MNGPELALRGARDTERVKPSRSPPCGSNRDPVLAQTGGAGRPI